MVARCLSCNASIIYVPALKFFPTENITLAAVRVWKTFLPDRSTILTSTSWLLLLSAIIENCDREGLGNAIIRSFIPLVDGNPDLPVTRSDAPGHTGAVSTILPSEATQLLASLT